MEKEAKKEAFRKYLESSGVVDTLTKVLVALYEQNNKPVSAVEFVQQKLGGPTLSEYKKLQSEMAELQTKYDELLVSHQETCRELESYKNASNITIPDEKMEDKLQTMADGSVDEKSESKNEKEPMSSI